MMRHKKLLKVLLFIILLSLGLILLLSIKKNPERILYGATFSKYRADELSLPWKDVYLAMLDDLEVRRFRLAAHWPMIEPKNGEYRFEEMDFQMKEAEKRGASVVLAVGRRLPSWPECHEPEWVKSFSKEDREAEILEYVETVVERYKNYSNIDYWQVENEPFLAVFAKEHCGDLDTDFLKKEIELVKKLDPSRKILVTDSGNLGLWYRAWKMGDVFGTSMYMYLWNPDIGQVKSVYLPSTYKAKANMMNILFGRKESVLIELSLEPWLLEPIVNAPMDTQLERMNTKKFDEIISFASKTGFEKQYLWGVEWWYWMKENGHTEFWEKGREVFEK